MFSEVIGVEGELGSVDMWVLLIFYKRDEKSVGVDFVILLEVNYVKFLILSFDVFVKVKRVL